MNNIIKKHNMDKFDFYHHSDSVGYDICYMPNKTIDELKDLCIKDKKCIGFNTLGFMKFYVTHQSQFKTLNAYTAETDGLYIYRKRYEKMQRNEKIKSHIAFDDYDFYMCRDSEGGDIKHEKCNNIYELKEIADSIGECVGFNTTGWLKRTIRQESEMKNWNTVIPCNGIYVKKTKFRVKLICNWTNSKNVCDEWTHMSKGNGRWNDIQITHADDADFFVIINKPYPGEFYVPERTIIFHMEPWCGNPQQNWGVKTWGEWAEPDESRFLQVRTHKKFYNNGFWQLRLTYNDLQRMHFNKTKLMSSICSSKYFDPGHIKRIDFLKYVESKNDDIVKIDIYNTDNFHNFKGYVGPHPPGNKDVGIVPYKYYFMPENNEEHNFITEKIWEPLLTETLAFYWGCPNISEYIDDRAYILLDLNDFEKSFNIIRDAILNNEWEKRIDVIRREKQKVLNYYNFFPTLERIICDDFKFISKPTDDDIIYHKYFSNLIHSDVSNICFLHSCTLPGVLPTILHNMMDEINDSKLLNKLDYLYIINIGEPLVLDYNKYGYNICNKIKLINYSPNTQLFELQTINLMKVFSKYHQNANILYLHTKGVSYKYEYSQVDDWRNMMMYFLVEKHNVCIELLDTYDTVGCNFMTSPELHYSGNFWWATAEHINKLDKIVSGDRHMAEWWVLSNNPNRCELFNSNINHYLTPFPRELYDTPEINSKLESLNSLHGIDEKMRIKCVNLVRRPDRKKYMAELLQERHLHNSADFFEAVDGQALMPTDELRKIFDKNDFGSRKSFIGCALSHHTLWNQLINDNKYDRYLILEDDIKIDRKFTHKMKQLYNIIDTNSEYANYDLLFLGYTILNHNKMIYDKKITTNTDLRIESLDCNLYVGGFFGYVITKQGASKLLNFISNNGIRHGIDYIPLKYREEIGLNMYEALPFMITSDYVDGQNGVDSDIQYNYQRLF